MIKTLVCFFMFLIAGCSLAPEYHRPVQILPDSWCGTAVPLEEAWWRRFQDKELDRLVEQALVRNKELEQGLARVDAARAALGIARADRLPTFSAQGSGQRSRSSADTSASYGLAEDMQALDRKMDVLMGRAPGADSLPSRTGSLWSGAVQAVWELDFWGKYRNAEASAREDLASEEQAQKALALSVAGQVCSAYFDLLSCDAQFDLTQRTLDSSEASLALYERQFAVGSISELDILEARTRTDSLRVSLAEVTGKREQAEAALLLLCGASAKDIFEARTRRIGRLETMPAVPQLPSGLPSSLLMRRPDIQSAEHTLKAAHFSVGAARAAFFPDVSLTGALGTESAELDRLFSGAAGTWNYGANLSIPLFTFGRTLSGVRQAEASMREAAAAYDLTVQQAFRDIRNALALQKSTAESVRRLEDSASRMKRAAELARRRYEQGYSPYLDVLEAERTLYSSQMSLAQQRAALLSAIAQVCVVLGGGWEEKTASPAGAS